MPEALRADARHNHDQLLTAARAAFAEHGTEASLRDIARRAGVGIGTLYRHFPTREALLQALMRDRFDGLARRAADLLAEPSPRDALATWLAEVAAGSATYRGLPESVMAALRDEESELHASCAAMRAAGSQLLERAQTRGGVRHDVTTEELLAIAAGMAWAGEQSPGRPELARRLLSLAMTGISQTEDPPERAR
ncbi:TetR/AcrR family transcriptional regulator [Nonomuraea sp. 3-1Str]|uniref:TetR/AcrR family transcriptional regulator n=1 Tax=unclassified Nonomuraea TaxID=2593643 RepID=UPI00285CF719|nr:helix-turn-helix domain-containing protein [Nonomuraea sp. 3-1Str]MDR8411142.1 TetR/AcrR family transcriptional regulator [Nonomuraea sp. 3-1Str]